MKKVLIPLLLILALLMGLSLTACGEKDDGATPDSASADQVATDDSRGGASASSAASAVASANEANEDDDKGDDSASSEVSKAAGGSSVAAAPQQGNVQNNNDNSSEDGQTADDPAPEKNADSPKSGSDSTSSVSPNPAYDDDHRPQFTIVMTDKSSKKEYSAACSYTTDKKDEAYASFFLPAGSYDIAVYEYADKLDKDHPLAESFYNNAKATKRKSIRVFYTPKDDRIEVKESASSRTQ
jgi:predicted small lipoprotein YifL